MRGLREAVRRELLARDAAADRRRRQAERGADVAVRPLPDGMAELTALLAPPDAEAVRDTIDRYARMARNGGDVRPIGMLRAEVLRELVLRPWDSSAPDGDRAAFHPRPAGRARRHRHRAGPAGAHGDG